MKSRHPSLQPLLGAAEEFRTMIVSMVVLFSLVMTLAIPQNLAAQRLGLCDDLMPGLSRIAELRRPTDRMFNDPASGSCLLLVDPRAKLFIDPRFDFYGGDFLAEAAAAMRMKSDWRAEFARWGVDSVLMRKAWPIAGALDRADDYRKIFDDGVVAFYRRKAGS